MDTKSITVIIIGLMVSGLILVAFVPIFAEITETEDTFDNTSYGYYQMKPLENGDSWTHSDNQWTYGDDVLTTSENTGISVIATNNIVVRQDGLIRGTTYGGNATSTAEVFVIDDSNTLQLNTTRNISFIDGFGAVPEGGDYVIKKYDTSAYVNGDSPLWVTGYTTLGDTSDTQVMVHIVGTIDDGLTITVTPKYLGTASDVSVVGDYVINYVEVDSHNDLYQLTNVKFTVQGTISDETVTKEFTYSTFVIPKTIVAEKSVHGDEVFNTVIDLIPLIAGVGLLMAGVYYFISRK